MGPVLGIESSCDKTATAVLDAAGRVLAEAVPEPGKGACAAMAASCRRSRRARTWQSCPIRCGG